MPTGDMDKRGEAMVRQQGTWTKVVKLWYANRGHGQEE